MVSGLPRSAAFQLQVCRFQEAIRSSNEIYENAFIGTTTIMRGNVPINLRDACTAGRELLTLHPGEDETIVHVRCNACPRNAEARPHFRHRSILGRGGLARSSL